jgi:glucokinase-like ROK family protein
MKKATREDSKTHNKTLIFNTLYHSHNASRADVSRITGLTRSTVSEIVGELIDEGLVSEVGIGQSAGGKPPVLLSVINAARQIIGIDLASGEFRGALINLRGQIEKRINIPINDEPGDVAVQHVFELIDGLIARANSPILGIGIGAPGLMDTDAGVVLNAVNLDWRDLPLGTELEKRYQIPVYIANDSQISALAEYNFGEANKAANLLLVKISRGVGAGIVINQQLFHGDSFGAGEIGHVRVEDNGELCRCGNYGCLETRISSRAIRRQAREIAAAHPDSLIQKISPNVEQLTFDQVFQAYQQGDPYVAELVQEIGQSLGKALSYVVSLLNIRRVVLAGSVAAFGEGLLAPANAILNQSILPGLVDDTELAISELGEEIVILGAAGMVLQNELGIL